MSLGVRDVMETYWWDVVVTSFWDVVVKFHKDVVETYHWNVLVTFHRDVVGYFIWDVNATSLGHAVRRRLQCLVARWGFKRTISWKKYRSEITTQPKNNNLDYLINPTFININRLFVLSFKNDNDDPTRYSFDKYYISLVEIKDLN